MVCVWKKDSTAAATPNPSATAQNASFEISSFVFITIGLLALYKKKKGAYAVLFYIL